MRELTADFFTTLDGFASGTEAPAYFGYLGPGLQRCMSLSPGATLG